jgi:hypothetical protein
VFLAIVRVHARALQLDDRGLDDRRLDDRRLDDRRPGRVRRIDAQHEVADAGELLRRADDGLDLFELERAALGFRDVLNGADDLLHLPGLEIGLPGGAHVAHLARALAHDAVFRGVQRSFARSVPRGSHPLAIIWMNGGEKCLDARTHRAIVVSEQPVQLFRPVRRVVAARPDEAAKLREALDLTQQGVAHGVGRASGHAGERATEAGRRGR